VHPELAAGGIDDRCGGAVVVAVRVGADDEADVAQLQLRLAERELELMDALLAADPGIEEDDAVAAGDRPRVDVRDPGPRARQPQPPDPGQVVLPSASTYPAVPASPFCE